MRGLPTISADNPSLTSTESIVILKTKRDRRRRKKLQDNNEPDEEVLGHRTAELVREDVYLMDNRTRRLHANLLANSLTARLRKNLPDDPKLQQSAMRKIRRDSLKDFVHLDNLNRQYACEMNWESNRLDNESNQLIKRHNQRQRHNEYQRKKQERLESSLRSRSGLSSASIFPRLMESGASCNEDDDFPEFAKVDKEDMSHVKYFKLKGVFQPQNKYSSRIESLEIAPKVKPKQNDLQESLKMADSGSPVDLPPRSRLSKKNLRVSWSSQSRYYSNSDDDSDSLNTQSRADMRGSRPETRLDSITPDHEENRNTPSTVKSFKTIRSDSHLVKRKNRKPQEKLESVGIQWKVQGNMSKKERQTYSPTKLTFGEVSRVLIPVTAALDKEGLSSNKLRWQTQKAQSPSTLHMYQTWLEKMELLKSSNPASIPSPVQKLPNRAYMSVMAHHVPTRV